MVTKQQLIDFWRLKRIVTNERLLQAFEEIPRERFVPQELKRYAYEDQPLPTMRNQSLSQPTTVMLMLQALELEEGDTVFEVGAGVGYQASLIAKIIGPTGKLVTVDVIPELAYLSRKNLYELNLPNAQAIEADGSEGYAPEAPYDRVIITAACPTIPKPIIEQMKENAVVVAPVGDLHSQTMVKGVKLNGKIELEFLGPFVFVPMKGKYGFKEAEMYYE